MHAYIKTEIPVFSLALMPHKYTKKDPPQKTKTKAPKNNQTTKNPKPIHKTPKQTKPQTNKQ